MPDLESALAPVLACPSTSVLLFDFDGTLASIVDDPAAATASPGVHDVLAQLSDQYLRVGVVSGRPVAFLADHLPGPVHLSGLYGLESGHRGRTTVRDDVDHWRQTITEAADAMDTLGLDDVVVERKGLSITVHYRNAPAAATAVEGEAAALAKASGLHARAAKMSVELHPPVPADKGAVVRELAVGATAVLYVGDDLGDLPAFAALGDLRAAGLSTVAVAVASAEAPAELVAVADVVVDGPAGVVDLLARLAAG